MSTNLKLVKEIKAPTKIGVIFLVDLGIIAAHWAVMDSFSPYVNDKVFAVYTAFILLLPLIMVLPSRTNPKRKTYHSIYFGLLNLKDKHTYHEIRKDSQEDITKDEMTKTKANIDTDKKYQKMKNKENKKRRKKNKKELKKIDSDVLMPVVRYDQDNHAFIMDDGTIFDLMKITMKDLNSCSSDDIRFDNGCWDKLYKIYEDDLKEYSIYYPTDTSGQQKYLNHKISTEKNPVYIDELKIRLAEQVWIEENKVDLEFYLGIFAKNQDDYRDKKITVISTLSRSQISLIKEITDEKKIEIIKMLHNKTIGVNENETA